MFASRVLSVWAAALLSWALLALSSGVELSALHGLVAADVEEDDIDNKVAFLVDSVDNLVVVRKKESGHNHTMVYFLNMTLNYTKIVYKFKTPLDHTDKHWEFVMDSKDNLLAVKKKGGASNKTEVHRIERKTNYSKFDLAVSTPLPPTGDNYVFMMDSKDNLVAVKMFHTATKKTEVHRITSASSYAKQDLQVPTGLNISNSNYSFMLDAYDNLVVVNRKGKKHTELYRFTAASSYAKIDRNVSTKLPRTGKNYDFVIDGRDRLLAIHKGPTTNSGKTHVERLDGPKYDKITLDHGTCIAYTSLAEESAADASAPVPSAEADPKPRRRGQPMMRAERLEPDAI